jgi:uncharacterized SAM-binding protein YcdF (DUF218 family)
MIIVLGSPNSKDGKLYNIARERCELAIREYRQRPGWKLLLTGGYGAHFNTTDQPHAAYLKHYLISRGIPAHDIVEFAVSTNTLEDASCSKPIVQKYKVTKIVVVTSDYHLDRARYVFEREYADTEIDSEFSATETDEEASEIDLQSQKKHEKESLANIKGRDKRT